MFYGRIPRTVRLHVLVDDELKGALTQQAKFEMTSVSALVRRLLRRHVEPIDHWAEDPIDRMSAADDFQAARLLEGDVYR